MMKFRDNLLYQRQQRNMTQEQLAMLLGVSRQSVTKWEAGQSTPEVDKLVKMAELFGCTLDELVSGDLRAKEVASAEVLPDDAPARDVCGYDEHRRSFALHIALGVGIMLVGVAGTPLLVGLGLDGGVAAIPSMGGLLAGLAFIIPAGLGHSSFAKAHPFVEDFYSEEEKLRIRRQFTWLLLSGIALTLVATTGVAIATSGDAESEIDAAIMLAVTAVGVFFIVYGSLLLSLANVENYNKARADEQWERDHPHVGHIYSIILLVATIIGVLLLFLGVGLFWLSWVFAGLLCAIVPLVMRVWEAK